MGQIVNIKKTIYDAASFNEVVDTSFTQLVPQNPTINVEENNVLSVDEFFRQYNNLFYEIPLTGSINSHEYIAERSLTYAGVSLQGIYDELEFLRQENIQLKNQIVSTTFTNLTP
jgi:hypothetical protein